MSMIKLPQKLTLFLMVAEFESKKTACFRLDWQKKDTMAVYTLQDKVYIYIYNFYTFVLFAPRFHLLWKKKGPDSDLTEHASLCIAMT